MHIFSNMQKYAIINFVDTLGRMRNAKCAYQISVAKLENRYANQGRMVNPSSSSENLGSRRSSLHFLECFSVIVLKEISNLQHLFEENFFVNVLLICENVCKRSLFLINFSVEICKRYI